MGVEYLSYMCHCPFSGKQPQQITGLTSLHLKWVAFRQGRIPLTQTKPFL